MQLVKCLMMPKVTDRWSDIVMQFDLFSTAVLMAA